MKKLFFLLALATMSIMTLTRCDDDDPVSPLESAKFKTFNDDMRELWSDHVIWTRNVIINVMDGAPGTDEAVNRLLKNQEDIGDAIKPYYGDGAGDTLTALLKVHITTAADLLVAAKNNNTLGFENAKTAWYENADDIAEFLNIANPHNFGLAAWKTMMKEHLDETLVEATARLNGDYDADVAAFDSIYNQALMMADMLAEGIANQFPNKF